MIIRNNFAGNTKFVRYYKRGMSFNEVFCNKREVF